MILKNAKIYTMNGYIIDKGYIRINEKTIDHVGYMDDLTDLYEESIDLKGSVVYPGFIDAHSHIGLLEDCLGFEGDDINESSEAVTPQLRAIDGINPLDDCFKESLLSGITSVGVSPGSSNPIAGQICAIKTMGKRIDNMIIKNPVAIKFALGENPKTTYKDKLEAPLTRMSTASLIYEQLKKVQKYIMQKQLYENNNDEDEPEYDIKCEALIPLLERKIKAHFHAHRTDDIFTALRIANSFNLDCCIIHATQGHLICDELKIDNPGILSGPILSERCKPEMKYLTPKSPGIMSESGLKVSITTDHPVIPQQYLQLCIALAVKEGMDPIKAIEAVTVNPAESLGISNIVGSLKAGKDADIVAFNGDAFDFSKRPVFVMCNGKIVLNLL